MKFPYSNRALKADGSAVAEVMRFLCDPTLISLAGGNPESSTFPSAELAVIAHDILMHQPTVALQYGRPIGYAPLRQAIRDRLQRLEHCGREFDDVIITSGSHQMSAMMCKLLCNEGDVVLVEGPSYIGAMTALRSFGAVPVAVDMDEEGLSAELLERAILANPKAKFLYTIPTFQNPTGLTMTAKRRKEIYDLCLRHSLLIVEDNPYSDLRFSGQHLDPIKALDTEGIVVYAGTFSKILSPGLRVGYLMGPQELVDGLVNCKQDDDLHSNNLSQMMVYEYLNRHDLDGAIVKMQALYGRKCRLMLDAIDAYFPKEVTHTVPEGGLFVWADMGKGHDTVEVLKRSVEKGVAFVPGRAFMADLYAVQSSFRLNFSSATEDKMVQGVEILGGVLKEFMKK